MPAFAPGAALKRLRIAARSGLLRGLRVFRGLLLLEFLPLLFLAVTQVILLLADSPCRVRHFLCVAALGGLSPVGLRRAR